MKTIILVFLLSVMAFGQSGKSNLTQQQKDSINAMIGTYLDTAGVSGNYTLSSVVREVGSDRDYTTIASAITAASSGDIVKVYSGIYSEDLTINKSISLIGYNAEVKSITVSVSDTVKIQDLSVQAGSDTGLIVGSNSIVIVENMDLYGGMYSSGTVRANNFNIYTTERVIITDGVFDAQGNRFYSKTPYFQNDAIVNLDYNRLQCESVTDGYFIKIENTSQVRIVANIIRPFTTGFADYYSGGTIIVEDSANLILSANDLNTGVNKRNTSALSEVVIHNTYGSKGWIHCGQYKDSGVFRIVNSTLICRNNNTNTHIIECDSSSGSLYIDNSTLVFANSTDGYTGSGAPIEWAGGNFYIRNSKIIDEGGDSTAYPNSIKLDFSEYGGEVWIENSSLIYNGDYASQSIFRLDQSNTYPCKLHLYNVQLYMENSANHYAFLIGTKTRDFNQLDTLWINNLQFVTSNFTAYSNTDGKFRAALRNSGTNRTLSNTLDYNLGREFERGITDSTFDYSSGTMTQFYLPAGDSAQFKITFLRNINGANEFFESDFTVFVSDTTTGAYDGAIYKCNLYQTGTNAGVGSGYAFTVTRVLNTSSVAGYVNPATTDFGKAANSSYDYFYFYIKSPSTKSHYVTIKWRDSNISSIVGSLP